MLLIYPTYRVNNNIMPTPKLSGFPRRRATDQDTLIEAQLVDLAYQNLPAMVAVNIAATLGVVFLLHTEGVVGIQLWFGLVLLLSLLRLFSWVLYKQCGSSANGSHKYIPTWIWLYTLGLHSAAVVWVWLLYMVFQSASLEVKFTVIVIISSLAGGATGITAPLKYAGRIYITILLLLTSIIIYLTSSEYWVLSVLGIVFFGAMIVSHRNNHRVLLKSLTLQLENKQLIHNLQNLNVDLEQRVQQRTEALKQIAHHDALTGLLNRPGLIDWMERNLSAENPQEAAVLFLDLDRFKQINDALGHEIGDQVLRMIAHRFEEVCPDDAIIARWGGDEFLLITRQFADVRERAELIAHQLIETATAQLKICDESLGVGLSVGMAYFPTDAADFQNVIHAADLTVAEVKRGGRGHSLVYDDIYAQTQKRRFDLGRALSEALKHNELTLAYQPVVNVLTGDVEALEVLSRWKHKTLGVIDPCEFIFLAEETDRINALGDWVLYESCLRVSEWLPQGSPIKLAINVSIKQLLAPGFSTRVGNILSETNFPAESLILEVTESLFGEEHLNLSLKTVVALREMGIDVYIDDFGTGYSSLSRLHEFPVTGIKIDRSFTAQVDSRGVVIIESAMLIAQRMNLRVIVEGVESMSQLKKLANLGVVSMQGYYFGRPSPIPFVESIKPVWRDFLLKQ
jgi:diguanylate cyclase